MERISNPYFGKEAMRSNVLDRITRGDMYREPQEEKELTVEVVISRNHQHFRDHEAEAWKLAKELTPRPVSKVEKSKHRIGKCLLFRVKN